MSKSKKPIVIETEITLSKENREAKEKELSKKLGSKVVILDNGMHVINLTD